MKRLVALLLCLLPLAALADPYPGHDSLEVTDLAGVIDADGKARIAEALATLRTETGVEATVLTIASRADYDASDSLESFATGLFNDWGIGNKERNDGILILVVANDREMRIELGAGYGPQYDIPAQDIINAVMLPAFRAGDLSTGIEAGTNAVIDHIALRHAGLDPRAGATALPEPGTGDSFPGGWIALLFGGAFAALVARGPLGRLLARLRACPKCGHRGLSVTDRVETAATQYQPGQGMRLIRCPECDWHSEKPYRISTKSKDGSGGSFGGGRSSGGGASGRW